MIDPVPAGKDSVAGALSSVSGDPDSGVGSIAGAVVGTEVAIGAGVGDGAGTVAAAGGWVAAAGDSADDLQAVSEEADKKTSQITMVLDMFPPIRI